MITSSLFADVIQSGYLNWFVFLQKVKESSSQVVDIANAMIKNVMTMNTYKLIEENYIKLCVPQYSKT